MELTSSGFKLALRLSISPEELSDALILEQFVPLTMKKRGVELRLVIHNQPSANSKVDIVLMKYNARAQKWFDALVSGEVKSLEAIATREGVQLSVRWEGNQAGSSRARARGSHR